MGSYGLAGGADDSPVSPLCRCSASCTALGAAGSGPAPHYATTVTSSGPINAAAIPLGDGYLSTTPKVGYVDSCQTSFPPAGGASVVGPWINTTNKTWSPTAKIHVQGSVKWPSASYKVTISGHRRDREDQRAFPSTTRREPSRSRRAIRRTPTTATRTRSPRQSVTWSLPRSPPRRRSPRARRSARSACSTTVCCCSTPSTARAATRWRTSCSTVATTIRCRAAHSIITTCRRAFVPPRRARSTLVGYAVDGFGIYVERNSNGQLLTNTDLDACHGRTLEGALERKEAGRVPLRRDARVSVHDRMLRGPARTTTNALVF